MQTRNMTEVMDQMNLKFSELKSELVKDLKEKLLTDIKIFLSEQTEILKNLTSKVTQHESTIAVLQNSVSKLTSENEALKRRIETEAKENVDAKINFENELNLLQQYSRRQCLRVDGVKVSDDIETSEDVVKIVHDFMKDVGIKTSDMVIDRAHRIGRSYMNEDNEKVKSIIVKFTNFRVRTLFYEKRKSLDPQIKVRIDLTKRNYDLLKKNKRSNKSKSKPKICEECLRLC